MKMFDLRWVVVLTVTLTTAYPDSEEKAHEMLPKPEGWQQRRPGGRSPTDSSGYDMNEAYNSLAANRVGAGLYSDTSASSNSKLGGTGYGDAAAASGGGGYYGSTGGGGGYGSYGSESGYGYSLTKYVDCSSALAILSLILFIDVLRDVVQQLTNSNRRRRRGAQFDPQLEEEHLLMQFISDGGVEALVGDLPHVIVPLMSHMSEATQEDTETTNTCLQRPLCDANAALAGRHGALGRILGALFSNVVTKGFIGADSSRYHLALDASRWGRLSGTNCQLAYPCDPRRNVTS
ncbi:uncharacterized protein LOC121864031 isoform X3 [Homarus americanus]|uniref:uncharacterized protein LOC121864031 isoform X3 n=1 Tax=Homarus americanus TaxID=6706 RepID=UPI001C482854|nr:uncharacterized protein LOC121864031 isoform X3 [Homarus americanus]